MAPRKSKHSDFDPSNNCVHYQSRNECPGCFEPVGAKIPSGGIRSSMKWRNEKRTLQTVGAKRIGGGGLHCVGLTC
jgi:hypothetical protein